MRLADHSSVTLMLTSLLRIFKSKIARIWLPRFVDFPNNCTRLKLIIVRSIYLTFHVQHSPFLNFNCIRLLSGKNSIWISQRIRRNLEFSLDNQSGELITLDHITRFTRGNIMEQGWASNQIGALCHTSSCKASCELRTIRIIVTVVSPVACTSPHVRRRTAWAVPTGSCLAFTENNRL